MARINARDRIGTTVRGFKITDVKRENGRTFAYIICPYCKKEKWMRMDEVVNGKSVSCGCYNEINNLIKPKDISGMYFGRLRAIRPTDKKDRYNNSIIWECECECGNRTEVAEYLLAKGGVRSCGCLGRESSSRNGKIAGKNIVDNFCIDGTNIKNLTAALRSDNASGAKGVFWDSQRNMWRSQIRFQGKNIYLGRYKEKTDAVKSREEAENLIFLPFLSKHREQKSDNKDIDLSIAKTKRKY